MHGYPQTMVQGRLSTQRYSAVVDWFSAIDRRPTGRRMRGGPPDQGIASDRSPSGAGSDGHQRAARMDDIPGASPPQDDRIRVLGVVDHHVSLGLRVDLLDVDLFADVVAIAMETFRLFLSLRWSVTLDASCERNF